MQWEGPNTVTMETCCLLTQPGSDPYCGCSEESRPTSRKFYGGIQGLVLSHSNALGDRSTLLKILGPLKIYHIGAPVQTVFHIFYNPCDSGIILTLPPLRHSCMARVLVRSR